MSGFLDGLGKVFGKIADQVQGRVERLKNEREKLNKEKDDLEGRVCTPESAARVTKIKARIDEIDAILRNKAVD